MTRIEMELELQAEIGIAPSEQGRVQRLTVTLDVELDDARADAAAASGRIDDTLDYGRLRKVVHDAFAERRYALLEEVTTLIRDRIRAVDGVVAARVGVTKHLAWADVRRLTLTR
ncbi:MAG TPA: dihydroneopterin aldolase [Caldimonas sp.]|nr:dihydroneopterin aldolase [Caldimonas sp.]